MNLLHIAIKVRIQVHPLRISKQNILVKSENMNEKKILSNIILLKSLPLILRARKAGPPKGGPAYVNIPINVFMKSVFCF